MLRSKVHTTDYNPNVADIDTEKGQTYFYHAFSATHPTSAHAICHPAPLITLSGHIRAERNGQLAGLENPVRGPGYWQEWRYPGNRAPEW